jgi:plasmid stability protein
MELDASHRPSLANAGVDSSDIIKSISEVIATEQILIRKLPAGTKAALKARAAQHRQSVEAEARDILAETLGREPDTLIELLSADDGADIEFEPERLGLSARRPEL